MFAKKYTLPVVLATAASAPYVVMDDGWYSGVVSGVAGMVSSESEQAGGPGGSAGTITTGAEYHSEFGLGANAQHPQSGVSPYVAGAPVADFGEIFRFDVSPSWVMRRWPRVTSTLAEAGLQGLRVPMVTGTRTDDLAGSLTYYFGPNHQMQRLSFEGYTGDPSRLMALVTQHYQMRPEPTLGAGMYVARWNSVPTSVLRLSLAPVISHSSPHAHMHVMMELNRPDRNFGLSPQIQQILQVDRHSQQ